MSKTSRTWLRRHVTDPYVHRARSEGYRSRAAYKLLEIDARDRLLRPGFWVVDLGAAPGSWSQVAANKVGAAGRVLALDLLPLVPLAGIETIQGDFREQAIVDVLSELLQGRKLDLVLSDLAPNLSGVAVSDQARMMHLAECVLEFAAAHLKPGGDLLVKVFEGAGMAELRRAMREVFSKIEVRKPDSSRRESAEMYLLARARRA